MNPAASDHAVGVASPRVLAVEHEESCPPALVGEWLTGAGCTLEVCRPYAGDALPALTSYDGVLVLGGEMGADDDHLHPWLSPLKAGIRDAVAVGTPLLGICLGHQLVATALGGVVGRNPLGRTVGLQPLGWSDDAATDELFGVCSGDERAIHWNDDVVVELPDGAVVLARTPGGEVQVARFAPRVWGVQSHPEADAAIIERWLATEREDETFDPQAVLTSIEAATAALTSWWQPVATRFAALVADDAGKEPSP
ncbi:type 1 glutamine amidotransferase [Nocardioides hwasunensis]|uniref:Type 1 glutamine amidotransferase n=1 Tax=Nocardioides hwasunensis TaxID=397258 RepID=A0ABR8MFM9_9ACTN|nr:type 1 glutamine amidotransferase [Nocardioides hwasunensis]MBD3914891.1 type 1 glutamine amidotransferase [Nocardioides hwasunensis]